MGVKGLWITPNDRIEPDLIIFYLHGELFLSSRYLCQQLPRLDHRLISS